MPTPNIWAEFDRVWPMIAAAPGLFALLVVACLLASWGFVHLLYRQGFRNKDTEIALKNAHITYVEKRKDDAERRLSAAEAELAAAKAIEPPVPEPPGPSSAQVAEPEKRLYMGRIIIDATGLATDHYLHLRLIAYNALPEPLRLDGIQGHVSYGSSQTVQESELVRLPPPALEADNPRQVPPFAGFEVKLSQRVPTEIAARIDRDLSTGDQVMFVLEGLHVHLSQDGSQPIRLPLWERVTCERTKRFTSVLPIPMLRARISLARQASRPASPT